MRIDGKLSCKIARIKNVIKEEQGRPTRRKHFWFSCLGFDLKIDMFVKGSYIHIYRFVWLFFPFLYVLS